MYGTDTNITLIDKIHFGLAYPEITPKTHLSNIPTRTVMSRIFGNVEYIRRWVNIVLV